MRSVPRVVPLNDVWKQIDVQYVVACTAFKRSKISFLTANEGVNHRIKLRAEGCIL